MTIGCPHPLVVHRADPPVAHDRKGGLLATVPWHAQSWTVHVQRTVLAPVDERARAVRQRQSTPDPVIPDVELDGY
jgi:hypothetical protein